MSIILETKGLTKKYKNGIIENHNKSDSKKLG